ncbi:hypothetical protein K431DRAFT_281117 [Polychaeton citri CBS 116435]|uniref:Uncharacterized protein n=1 Tax=Polychaeton citri CBS 116435 TaxID=1314669 RepID=A0A9P4UTV7_9PEZI|nr:hypothetical protein K431DRAFT_281117 [Polychaeton citri CBS 116435]
MAVRPTISRTIVPSEDELRRRIFVNASVLFPHSVTQALDGNQSFEIVYGTWPHPSTGKKKTSSSEPPYEYALLVRRNPSGDFTPLMRGNGWSTSAAWSLALNGLLDVTSAAIHRKFANMPCPSLESAEELPNYEKAAATGEIRGDSTCEANKG